MKIKKILVLLLVVCTLPLFGVMSSADTSAVSEVSLLKELEILPDDFNANSKMSREKFVTYLLGLINTEPYESGKPIPFTDLSEKSAAYLYVKTAFEMGLVSGTGEGFKPKETVSFSQGVKMMLSALGYDVYAASMGGYPSGYMIVAQNLKLLRGLNLQNDAALKGEHLAILFYNALDVPVLQNVGVEGGGVKYSDEDGETLLSLYHHIEIIKEQLRGSSGVLLSGNYNLKDNKLLLGDKVYKAVAKNFDSLVGYMVNAYYDTNSETVLAVEKQNGRDNTVLINHTDILGYSNGSINYYAGEKHCTEKIETSADVNYNGRKADDITDELFKLSDGTVTLIDSDNSGSYDVVLISEFENYVVAGVGVEEKTVYDLYDSKKVLEVLDTDEIFIDDFGNKMYFEELKKYDVLSVWQSHDGENIKIRYSNKELRASVEEISTSQDGYVILDGDEFKFAKNFFEEAKSLSVGDSGTFVLDASGKIAAFIKSNDSVQYAYLLSAAMGDSALKEELKVRVMNTLGNMEILECDMQRLTIDGSVKTAGEALEIFKLSQLIRYETNADGKITMIDTQNKGKGDNDLLLKTHTSYDSSYQVVQNLRFSRPAYLFSGKIPVESGVTIFNVPYPDTLADDDEYYLTSIATYKDASNYHFESYKTGNDGFINDVLIRYHATGAGGASIENKSPITVIDDVVKALNDDGGIVTKLCCYHAGAYYKEYVFAKEEIYSALQYTLKKGDIVRLNVNENTGKISAVELVYDRENKVLTEGATIGTTEYFLEERFVKGSVYEKDGSYISLTQVDLTKNSEVSDTLKEYHVLSPSRILLYDSTKSAPKLSPGALSDVRDFKTFGNLYSNVVIFNTDGGAGSTVVIYK